jgi:hypothetical protein
MKIRTIATALCTTLTLALPIAAQQKEAPAQPSQAEMEAMMKAMSPGENHKHLNRSVGDWTTVMKVFPGPGQPPMESTGTMHSEWILDGRYVQSIYKGSMMGMPFEGRGVDGYDNMSKQYVSTWIDNMGTGIMYSTGTCDAGCKTLTTSGDMIDPMSGQKMTIRFVVTYPDDKTFVLNMYGKDASGTEMPMMEMTAKKK